MKVTLPKSLEKITSQIYTWYGPVGGSFPIHRSPIAYPSVSIDDYIL